MKEEKKKEDTIIEVRDYTEEELRMIKEYLANK